MSKDEGPDNPETIRHLFNRSPHPYHRPSFNSSERFTPYPSAKSKSQSSKDPGKNGTGNFIRSNTSPSDSGTEADDEKPILRALTAPPIRPRKGLKGLSLNDDITDSVPTQYGIEDDKTRLLAGHAILERKKSGKQEILKRNKGSERPGLEFTRRVSECIIFGCICGISLYRLDSEAMTAIRRNTFIIVGIYSLYIPSLIIKLYHDRKIRRSWLKIWFPASSDPASLLYPVFLPLCIYYSIGYQQRDIIVSHILSFCAIPPQIVPFQDYNIQWFLSLIPLMTPDHITFKISPEEVVLLFPLHYALMQTLYFLTTTSLLTTELQLLSIALINLLGVPKTPQSSILKALLWIGGISMLVSCRHVLKLSVELARIPTWRLKRVKRPVKARLTIYHALDDTLGGFLSRRIFLTSSESSDEDITRLKSRSLDDLEYLSSSFGESRKSFIQGVRHRRHTLPTNLSTLPDLPTLTRTATDVLSSARTRSRLILRLTLPQAIVLKWLYAIFIYLMTTFIIMIPIRLYVQYFALDGREPVGWALGYLFGDYQPFKMQTIMLGLDSWICLPSRDFTIPNPGTMERLRQEVLGAANTRLLISLYCLTWISIGLLLVIYLSNIVEVDTRRKVFHGMMVMMFLPTIFIDPTFISLALMLVLAIFLLLDLFRASQLPPLSKPLTYFLAPYVDGRDHKGPIIISHIFLLIGCAIPLWLSLAFSEHTGDGALTGWEVPNRNLTMITGVVCVGMGDAAASLIGRRYGRRRWPWSGGKSLEGSAAFVFAVYVGLFASRIWLVLGGWSGDSDDTWSSSSFKMIIAAIGASLTEAVLTGGNDNVVVPIILWLLTKGLAI